MNEIVVPVLNIFESNPWSKIGNMWTGSVGADSLHNNAFLYRINFFRDDDGQRLVAECYDCITQMAGDESQYQKAEFDGTEEGRLKLIDWLNERYDAHVSSGAAAKYISFNG